MKHFVAINFYRFLILLPLFFICNVVFGQQADSVYVRKIYYKLTFQPDSLDSFKKEEKFVLLLGDNESLFTDVINKKADSMEVEIREYQKKYKPAVYSFRGVPKAKFTYYIRKQHNETPVINVFEKIGAKHFVYKENTDFNWKLHSEIKEIEGYQCQKATSYIFGRHFTAWFTREIAINDGPYKFYGLPGLILEIEDSQSMYHFRIMQYSSKENEYLALGIPNFRLNKIKESDKETFVKAKHNYDISIIERLKNSLVAESLTTERINEIKQRLKKNNNPLELKP